MARSLLSLGTRKEPDMTLIALLPALLATQPLLEDLDLLERRLSEASAGMAMPLDRRLRLARCPSEPNIAPVGNNSFELSCPEIGWRFRIANRTDAAGSRANVTPMVRRGEEVLVEIVGDDFTVQSRAVATEAGRAGETVRVRFPGLNSQLSATVSGPGKVRILD